MSGAAAAEMADGWTICTGREFRARCGAAAGVPVVEPDPAPATGILLVVATVREIGTLANVTSVTARSGLRRREVETLLPAAVAAHLLTREKHGLTYYYRVATAPRRRSAA